MMEVGVKAKCQVMVRCLLIIGAYEYRNRDKFDGEWKDGLKVNKGLLYLSNQDEFQCEWVEDKMINSGTRKIIL